MESIRVLQHYRLIPVTFLSRSEGLNHDERVYTDFKVASDGLLFEGYGHGGSSVCLGDGQTESYLKDMGMTGFHSGLMVVFTHQNQNIFL